MKILLSLVLASLSSFAQTNLELLEIHSKNYDHGKVRAIYTNPKKESEISAHYQFAEIKLAPKDVLYFLIPDRLSDRPLSQIGIAHRQVGHAPDYDYSPGLTSVLVYTKDYPGDELRYWAGHASGEFGAKFAEYRRSPEMDSLYEWPRIGHKGIRSKRSKELIKPNFVRVQNVGADIVHFSELYIEVVPSIAQKYETFVFTPKSDFGHPITMEGRFYGGGRNQQGRFPKALRLESGRDQWQPILPDNMKIKNHKLFIDLPEGVNVGSVDVMCGDTHPDGVRNRDGGWGSLGSARLSVYVEDTLSGLRRYLIKEKNVGPQGVISASDISSEYKIKKNERLVISNLYGRSTLYVMALRLGLNNVN